MQADISMEGLPDARKFALTILFYMIVEDFLFFATHRFLHWKRIYPYIHKIHHEYTVTVSWSSEYAHPIEYLIGNIIPTGMG